MKHIEAFKQGVSSLCGHSMGVVGLANSCYKGLLLGLHSILICYRLIIGRLIDNNNLWLVKIP